MSHLKNQLRNSLYGVQATHCLVVALVAALGVSVGMNLRDEGPTLQDLMPTIPAHAATAQGYDNFSVATGPVDGDVEAFYFLDFLTGDLRATAINTRQGEFGAFFEYNIARDFDVGAGKNPRYLMVTGTANIPRGRGNTQIASSVVYITECTTGQMAAYVMPWNSSMQASGKRQTGTFLKIANVQLRSAFVRDQ